MAATGPASNNVAEDVTGTQGVPDEFSPATQAEVDALRPTIVTASMDPADREVVSGLGVLINGAQLHAGRAEYDADETTFLEDTALALAAKEDVDDPNSLRAPVGVLTPTPVYGVNSCAEDNAIPRESMDGLVVTKGAMQTLKGELQAFFSSDLLLQSANTPRDFRKLSASLGGDNRGATTAALQGAIPEVAPSIRKEARFEEVCTKIFSELFASKVVEEGGGFDMNVAPAGAPVARRWADWATIAGTAGMARALLINAGHTAAGALQPFAPLPGANNPPGSGSDVDVVTWLLRGGNPPANWPYGPGALPRTPIDANSIIVLDDRYAILTQQQISWLLWILGSNATLNGLPEPGNGALMPTVRTRVSKAYRYVCIVGRSIPAAVPDPTRPPTAMEVAQLVDTLSRLLPGDAMWSRGALRSMGDWTSSTVQPHAGGPGMGGNSPARVGPAAGWQIGATVGVAGGTAVSFTTETDTLCFLFAGVHLHFYSTMGTYALRLVSVDNPQLFSYIAKLMRKVSTNAQSVFRANFRVDDLRMGVSGFGGIRSQMGMAVMRQKSAERGMAGAWLGNYEMVAVTTYHQVVCRNIEMTQTEESCMRYMLCADLWSIQNVPDNRRWLELFPCDSGGYWLDEVALCGLLKEEFTVLKEHELATIEEIIAAAQGIKIRANVAPVLGESPDLGVLSELSAYQGAFKTALDTKLLAMVKGLGSIAFGQMVAGGVAPNLRLLTLSRTARSLFDTSVLRPVGNITVGFSNGFLRTGQMPVFVGTAAECAITYYSMQTTSSRGIQLAIGHLRSDVARDALPLQFKSSAALELFPSAGLTGNLLLAGMDY